MKKYLGILILVFCVLISGCTINPNTSHIHKYVDGVCSCGIKDPNYKEPSDHQHEYVDGVCSCGIKDPNYKEPSDHQHKYVDGVCNCGIKDPNYKEPSDHQHKYVDGYCSCGEKDPDYEDSIIDPNVEKINLLVTGSSFEVAYCEWEPYSNATSYNVYCDGKLIDKELIRNYNSYYRADIVGLKNKEYTIKVSPIVGGKEIEGAIASFKVTPVAHLREGFGFVNGTSSGAYNDDGTLKSDARVIYITNDTKDTVTLKIQTGKNTYTDAVGIQNILNALKKGYETKPICFRFIGNITDPAVLDKGDILIDGSNKFKAGITFEGIGNDATFNGFGLRIKSISNVEIRNLGFMNCDSNEGDSISLQQDNDHVWVHNCDIFYGQAGSDADQDKGDGALDVKKSTYVTLSYNHYFDTGKSNLQGMKDETEENYISYHHNWYDHSDSRHPRVRTCTVHVYNNYYTGIAKYAVGATMGSSIFVENNYFENCKNVMLSSLQGTDALGEGTFSSENGGMIKAFGNVMVGCNKSIKYSENNTSFDYYDASRKDEVVPSSVKTLVGGTTYNNFDTSSAMYSYTLLSAEDAKENVLEYAGRLQGGDFKWTFANSDNSSYEINVALKEALLAYEPKLNLSDPIDVTDLIYNISTISTNPTYSEINLIENCYEEYMSLTESNKQLVTNGNLIVEYYNKIPQIKVNYLINQINGLAETDIEGAKVLLKIYNSLASQEKKLVTNYNKLISILDDVEVGKIIHNFGVNEKNSDFFNITGNLSTASKYGVPLTYNGLVINKCLKLESSTSITFELETSMTLTLVFIKNNTYSSATIKIDGEGYGSSDEHFTSYDTYITFSIELEAGSHTISKKDSQVLFYMTLE